MKECRKLWDIREDGYQKQKERKKKNAKEETQALTFVLINSP